MNEAVVNNSTKKQKIWTIIFLALALSAFSCQAMTLLFTNTIGSWSDRLIAMSFGRRGIFLTILVNGALVSLIVYAILSFRRRITILLRIGILGVLFNTFYRLSSLFSALLDLEIYTNYYGVNKAEWIVEMVLYFFMFLGLIILYIGMDVKLHRAWQGISVATVLIFGIVYFITSFVVLVCDLVDLPIGANIERIMSVIVPYMYGTFAVLCCFFLFLGLVLCVFGHSQDVKEETIKYVGVDEYAQKDMCAKLKTLQDAYDMGVLSEEEYHKNTRELISKL